MVQIFLTVVGLISLVVIGKLIAEIQIEFTRVKHELKK